MHAGRVTCCEGRNGPPNFWTCVYDGTLALVVRLVPSDPTSLYRKLDGEESTASAVRVDMRALSNVAEKIFAAWSSRKSVAVGSSCLLSYSLSLPSRRPPTLKYDFNTAQPQT